MKQAIEARKRADLLLSRVSELETARDTARRSGQLHGEIDGRLEAARTDACGALLSASQAARDAGLTGDAKRLAKRYAEQEHLALSMRQTRAWDALPNADAWPSCDCRRTEDGFCLPGCASLRGN